MTIDRTLMAEILVMRLRGGHYGVIANLQGYVSWTTRHLDVQYAAYFNRNHRGAWAKIEGLAPAKTIDQYLSDRTTGTWEMIHYDKLYFSHDAQPGDLLQAPTLAGIGIMASMVNDFPATTAQMENHGVWTHAFVQMAKRAWDYPEEDLKLLIAGAERPEDRLWSGAVSYTPAPLAWEDVEKDLEAEWERRSAEIQGVEAARIAAQRAEEDRRAEAELQSLLTEQDMKGFGAWA